MDYVKAVEETKKMYEQGLAIVDEAEKICKAVDPRLPKDWYSVFHVNQRQVEFTRLGEADALEFRVVCDLVEAIVGTKLHRGIGALYDTYLYGWQWLHPEGGGTLDIRVELNKPDGCKITYKRKWSKEPVVDEACLGIRKVPEEATK